jgi:hypothetical protein
MATTNTNFKVKNNLEVLGTGTSTVAGALQITGAITGITTANISGQVTSTVSTGTAPFIVSSTTLVSNLNTQYLNSQLGSYYLDLTNATSILPAVSMPAMAGDVTSTVGTVATTIAAGAVTLAKMANVATGTVFYRKTAATGAPEVQTLATLKTDLGLTGINSGDQTTISGNAGTATALATARTLTIGATGKSFNGSVDVAWTLAEIGAAGLASPTFTGVPAASTAAVGTNTTQLATTAFVTAEIANDAPTKTGTGASGTWGINVTGSAATLTTPRTIAISGKATGTATSFDGSANITVPITSVSIDGTEITSGTVNVLRSWALAGGDVTSPAGSAIATIGNNTVTLAKMATMATTSLLGRSTAGTGNVEALTIGTGLSLSAGVLSATNTSAGTVTSVAASVPTGFAIAGSPVTSTGTLAITYAGGYQGYTSAEATKLSGIATGATANTGTVTSVSVTTASGVSGSVATSTSTPAITITLSAITPTSVAATGTVTGSNLSGTNTGDQTTVTGNAGSATVLQTARTIAISGKITGTATSFNGSAAITIPITAVAIDGADITTGTVNVLRSWALAGGDVTSPAGSAIATIGANTVTLAKMATMATTSLLGRSTAGVGNPEVISIGTGLSLTGGVLSVTASGSGTVTSVSVVTANGISGTVATATTTPAITLTLGAITPTSVAASGTVTGSNLSGTHSGASSGTNTGDQTNITGNAGTVSKFVASDTGNPVAPDTVASNVVGYASGVSLLGQTDGALFGQAFTAAWQHQIFGDYRTGQILLRGKNNGTWQPWRSVLDSSNYSTLGAVSAATPVFTGYATHSYYGGEQYTCGNSQGYITHQYSSGDTQDLFSIGANWKRATSTTGAINNSVLGTAEVLLIPHNGGTGSIGKVFINTGAYNTAPSTRVQIDQTGAYFSTNIIAQNCDLYSYRTGGTTGVIFLNSAGTKYLYNDGSLYQLAAQGLNVAGAITATDLSATSDAKLKDVTGSLLAYERLTPKRFKWKDTGKEDFGFIAQDVEKDYPEAVHVGTDDTMFLNYGKLTAVLAAQLNRATSRIDELERRLTEAGIL